MARIILTRLERKKDQFKKMLRVKKAEGKFTDKAIAKAIGITQPSVSYKNANAQYSYTDLVILFDVLQYSDEQILEVMKYGT